VNRLRVPALLGGEAHGMRMDWPDPWPLNYQPAKEHEQTYTLFIAHDPKRGWIEFFALDGATDAMREGWLDSWLRENPDWGVSND